MLKHVPEKMPNYNVAVKFSGRFLLCTANNGGSFQSVARYNLLTLGNEVHLYGFSICRKVIKLSKQQIKKLLLNLQYKKTYEQYRRTYYVNFLLPKETKLSWESGLRMVVEQSAHSFEDMTNILRKQYNESFHQSH
jgi:hypothetical protein